MGSPLSPIVANLYMEHFERIALDSSPLQPKLWLRYVDDTFGIWPHGQSTLQPFLEHLNSTRTSIQFTMEEEQDEQIAFLDMLVKRTDDRISTTVHRKRTHTDRYLNYHSHHHPRVMMGDIKCLRDRASKICDPPHQHNEFQHLYETFRANGFPSDDITSALSDSKCNRLQQSTPMDHAHEEGEQVKYSACHT